MKKAAGPVLEQAVADKHGNDAAGGGAGESSHGGDQMTTSLNQREFHEPDVASAPSGEAYMTIGQMASDFGVSLRTLRFYEDRRLLSPLRQGTARLYDHRQRARLQMILKGKRLGFTLSEISSMLGTAAREEPAEIESALAPDKIVSQISALERQREMLDAAISELYATRQKIEELRLSPGSSRGVATAQSAA